MPVDAAVLGYLALFVGAVMEGETVVFLAGMAAQQGYLWFPAVILLALIGGFVSDQILFFVGRRYGHRILARFPKMAARAPRIQAAVRRWDVLAIITMRFLYGLRTAAPIIIGGCGISPWRLALFDFIGASLWASVVASAGYFAGQAIQAWVGRIDASMVLVLAAVVLALGTAWNVFRSRKGAMR